MTLRDLFLVLVCAFGVAAAPRAHAQNAPAIESLARAVVRIKTFITPEARTLENLGREREGSGVVIDNDGLVLTIGYLMVEAYAAEITGPDGRAVAATIVGYDHETGFGLLRADTPLKVTPLPLGKSADVKDGDAALVIGSGGVERAAGARVVSRREFAGSWEYLLDSAIFTTPPYANWSGAALVARDGKLVGIGSLVVGDASGSGDGNVGNMFVPIDLLPPILADLIADGRTASGPRPWLGVTTELIGRDLLITKVASDSPAEKAGLRRGDLIVGVGDVKVEGQADFYRKLWQSGAAGATVPLEIERSGDKRRVDLRSVNRMDHLKLKGSL